MITIEMWSDIVCPWCQIGRKRLDRAIARRPGLRPRLVWRAFQLHPDWPAGGIGWDEFTTRHWGSPAAARPIFEHVEETGAVDGLTFDFTRISRVPRTTDAHRLILHAQRSGSLRPTVEALAGGYFSGASDLTDRSELARLGAMAGVGTAADIEALLEGSELVEEVWFDQAVAAETGIRGVPFFLFDGRLAVSGAQSEDVFLRALDGTPTTFA